MQKVIITVVGRDKVGIIAKVCTYLSEAGINIMDISQTIIDGYFNMIMITDYTGVNRDFRTCQEELEALGKEIGLQINSQKEEIFDAMHRL